MQHQIESLERSVREKSVEIKQLQKQNAELERARHTEVVKLRLEVWHDRIAQSCTDIGIIIFMYAAYI